MTRVCALQLAARWDQTARALARVDELLAERATDLALLPEASLTGYVSPRGELDLTRFAESPEGATGAALGELARRHHTALVAPLVWRHGERVHNAMIGFDAQGQRRLLYAKVHPWYPETWATPGTAVAPRVELAGARCSVAVCFDLQWPDVTDALGGVELLLFASAWVDSDGTRVPLLQALAARHRMHVLAANWCRGDVEVPGQGESCVIGPDGVVLASAGQEETRVDAELPLHPRTTR